MKTNMEEPAPNCIQKGPRCESWPQCERCGFDQMEYERRLWAIRHGFMKKNKKGLLTLKVGRKKRGGRK